MWFLSRELGTLHLLVSLLSPIQMHRKAGSDYGIAFSDPQHLIQRLDDLFSRDAAMLNAMAISESEAQESAASALHAILGE